MQYHAIPCNTMQYHAILCNTMQYQQYHASLLTADGAYHCPVGSIWLFFSNSEAAMLSMLSPFLKMQQCWVLNLWGDPYNTIIQTLERIHTDNYITWIDIQNDNFYRRQKIQIQIQPKYFFESCARQFLRPLSVFKWKQNYHQNQW